MNKKRFLCPRCGSTVEEYPAISRQGSKIWLCGKCYIEEEQID